MAEQEEAPLLEDVEFEDQFLAQKSNTITTQAIFSLSTSSARLSCPGTLLDDSDVGHNKRKLIIAIVLCFGFFLIELLAGIFSGSLAILSDSFHLLSDIAGFGISLSAIYLSQQPATPSHSFGFHRAEILGAILSTFLIWILTVGLVWEAVKRLYTPVEIDARMMFWTALVGVCVNLVLGWTLHSEHEHGHGHGHHHSHGHSHSHSHSHSHDAHEEEHEHNHSDGDHHEDIEAQPHKHSHKQKKSQNINIKSATLHVLGDLISSIGVLISAAIIWYNPKYTFVDPICTFIFSGLVLLTTVKLMKNSLGVLMEGTPKDIDPHAVAQDLRKIKGVIDVHDLHIWNLTIGKSALAAHLDILPSANDTTSPSTPHITIEDFNNILTTAQNLICEKYGIHHSTIQLEVLSSKMSTIRASFQDSGSSEDEDDNCYGTLHQHHHHEGKKVDNVKGQNTHCMPVMCRKVV
ncbi:hypothetical protein HK098_000540 [Nowakowskiella sp. JEL0407]|nr:hypothetical protein HK098_000540 [Nowakowskiella sp. JEL0407]